MRAGSKNWTKKGKRAAPAGQGLSRVAATMETQVVLEIEKIARTEKISRSYAAGNLIKEALNARQERAK